MQHDHDSHRRRARRDRMAVNAVAGVWWGVGRQVHLRGRSVLKPSRIASPQVATCDDGMDNGWYVEQVFTVGR